MRSVLKATFLVHAVVAALSGMLLLFIPGNFLRWIGWTAFAARADWIGIDLVISRLLGAALIALAWSSFRGWRATETAQIANLVEMEVVFTVLSCAGLLRHLAFRHLPMMVWILFAVFALFAVAWIVSLVGIRRE
jgi:hypothetical protein